MTEHILDLLRKRKLRSLQRSEDFQKVQDKNVERKAASVKRIIGGEDQYSAVPVALTSLRDLYFHMLRTYSGKVTYYSEEMNDKSVALWMRVEKARIEADCDAEHYMKAQFMWFDKVLGKPPTTLQLATEAAIERARQFEGKKGRVLGNMRAPDQDKADVFRQSEKTLQKMMTAQNCGREEFYRRFVLTGVYTFPKEFLEADPAYQAAKEG